jgi:hypothetical protein
MKAIQRILLIGVVVGVAASCEPQHNENCGYGFQKGTVENAGAPEVDGCGWLITIGGETYHPVNLDEEFKVADLPVLLKFSDDPEEYWCGRGGRRILSIRIIEMKINAPGVGVLKNDEWDKYDMDSFRLDSAYIDGDYLMMLVNYSGGCRDHEFNLWKLPPNALDPPPVELALSHNANGDMCEAWISRWLVFSLVPIRERGKSEVSFLLRGSPEMSAYFGRYTYKY